MLLMLLLMLLMLLIMLLMLMLMLLLQYAKSSLSIMGCRGWLGMKAAKRGKWWWREPPQAPASCGQVSGWVCGALFS
jgi:hypothetical protein